MAVPVGGGSAEVSGPRDGAFAAVLSLQWKLTENVQRHELVSER